jgi:hypothetical protein
MGPWQLSLGRKSLKLEASGEVKEADMEQVRLQTPTATRQALSCGPTCHLYSPVRVIMVDDFL